MNPCTAPVRTDGEACECGRPAAAVFYLFRGSQPLWRCADHARQTRQTLSSWLKGYEERALS